MQEVTLYQTGAEYSLRATGPDSRVVVIGFPDEATIKESAIGESLFYRPRAIYGTPIAMSLRQGWCWIVSESPT